jgi:hypothetical protein
LRMHSWENGNKNATVRMTQNGIGCAWVPGKL